jgi:pilus assembly protein FimV
MIAGLVVLALILIGLLRKRRGGEAPLAAHGPLADPEDVAPQIVEPEDESALQAQVAEHPEDLAAHLALCRFYYGQEDEARFVTAATAMREHVSYPHGSEWQEVATMGEELAPHLPLFELSAAVHEDTYGMAALHQPAEDDATVVRTSASHAIDARTENEPAPSAPMAPAHREPDVESVMQAWRAEPGVAPAAATEVDTEQEFADDPVDTKLDLARAYLDMGDPVGARAMLEEVIEEGSQAQKDQAKRLLADVAG